MLTAYAKGVWMSPGTADALHARTGIAKPRQFLLFIGEYAKVICLLAQRRFHSRT